jgi:hypothetical protein
MYKDFDSEVNNTIAHSTESSVETKQHPRGHWFRVYDSILNDPKVQQLPAKNFRGLINLWSLTSQKDGAFLSANDIAFGLRIKPNEAAKMLAAFKQADLIDETPQGFRPHNWETRQRKSDTSNQRVRRHRERQRDENVTLQVTDKTRYVKRLPSGSS